MDGTQKWSTVAHWMSTSRRSEEHTSVLQSQSNLVCRLLLEKKNIKTSCLSMEAAEFTENLINRFERLVNAPELFAFSWPGRADTTDVLPAAEDNVYPQLRAD